MISSICSIVLLILIPDRILSTGLADRGTASNALDSGATANTLNGNSTNNFPNDLYFSNESTYAVRRMNMSHFPNISYEQIIPNSVLSVNSGIAETYLLNSTDLIQKGCEDLNALSNEASMMYEEANETAWEFILERNQSLGENAINKTLKYSEILEKLVHRTYKFNELKLNLDDTVKTKCRIDDVEQYEDDLQSARNMTQELKHLHILMKLNFEYKHMEQLLNESDEEYSRSQDLKSLEVIIENYKELIKILTEFIDEERNMLKFFNSRDLNITFDTSYTRDLIDIETWQCELHNQTKDLEDTIKFLEEETFRYLLQKKIKPAAQILEFVVGIVGNGVLLLVFARHKDMRTAPNVTVLNLTVSDFLSLLINVLVFRLVEIQGTWELGLGVCRLYRFLRQLCLGVSVYSIVVISVQRYLAMNDFLTRRGFGCRIVKNFDSILLILSVWIIGSILSVDVTMNAVIYENRCVSDDPSNSESFLKRVITVDFVAFCIVPFIIIAFTSTVTAKRLKKSVKIMPGEGTGQDKVKKARVLSSNILIALAVVFAICYIPYYLFIFIHYWFELKLDVSVYRVISFVTFTLIFANGCFNPIAVYVASRKYRRYMNLYLFCRKDKMSTTSESTVTTTSAVETRI
ncbi:phe13-bombesin receptor-like [Periplaneta americana]|uniref:phe13-bombesin receptor-like n=1 Tax=Periplaneta americana TaxID=6978 RepID=UPI0037E8C13B